MLIEIICQFKVFPAFLSFAIIRFLIFLLCAICKLLAAFSETCLKNKMAASYYFSISHSLLQKYLGIIKMKRELKQAWSIELKQAWPKLNKFCDL